MDPVALAGIRTLALAGLGFAFQWVRGQRRIPNWISYSGLVLFGAGTFLWATPGWNTGDWRLTVFNLATFVLAARGAGSASKDAKVAPAANSMPERRGAGERRINPGTQGGNMRHLVVILVLVLATNVAQAQERYSIWDWQQRTQVSLSSGYLQFQPYNEGGEIWRGVDLGGSLTYSLHPQASVYATYAHGFPLEAVDGHENQARLVGNLKLYPTPDDIPGPWALFAGAGLMWRGSNTVKDWSGIETHATLSVSITEWLAAFGAYYHGFAARPEKHQDLDFLRAGLNARLGR